MLPPVSPAQRIAYYASLGGTPYYLEAVRADESYEQNIARLFFDRTGLMFDEPAMLLRQELREPSMYRSVLRAIAYGANRSNEVADRAGVPASSVPLSFARASGVILPGMPDSVTYHSVELAAAEGETASSAQPAAGKIPAPPATNEHVRKSMQGNKRKDTKPELLMRARLRAAGLVGYRLQWKVPGRPDIAWPGKRVAIQVMGCFWHRCPHCNPSTPKSHVEYWAVKFERNVQRDERALAELRAAGWTVHVVWECQLKKKTIDATLHELFPQLSAELGKPLAAGWDE